MADETVSIKIKVDAHDRQLNALIAKVATLERLEKRLSSGRNVERYANNSASSLAKAGRAWKRNFDQIDGMVKGTGKLLTKFLTTAIKGVIVQMTLMGASMVAVHAAFAAGNLIMKAYRGTMQIVATGAAAATVAIAGVASAIREQQAAIFGYRGKGAKEFGSGMNQTRMAMRNLQADANLATLGVEALNKAYGNMSKSMNVAQINASGNLMKSLMDFGAAGQDPAKGLEQVAVVIAALADKKKSLSDVMTEAKKLGPEMEKALKSANVKTKDQFKNLLLSGDLAKKGGVAGQFANINNTLIGQLKAYFTRIRTDFADFGDQFLEPLKVAFEDVFQIIRRDLQRIDATVAQTFGAQGFIDGFVSGIGKFSDFMIRLMREYLPRAIGMFDRFGDWWNAFTRGWNIVLDRLRPLIGGAKVIYEALDPIWQSIKRAGGELFNFSDSLQENGSNMREFGEQIAKFLDTAVAGFKAMRAIFAELAPFINDVLSGVQQIFKFITEFMTAGAGKGFAMALAPLLAFSAAGRGMASVKGRFMPNVGISPNSMVVNAQQVTVTSGQISRPAAYSTDRQGIARGSIVTPYGVVSSGGGGGSSSQLRAAVLETTKLAKADKKKEETLKSGAAKNLISIPGLSSLKNQIISGGITAYAKAGLRYQTSKFGPGYEDRANRYTKRIERMQRLDALIAAKNPSVSQARAELRALQQQRESDLAGYSSQIPAGAYTDAVGLLPFERDGRTATQFRDDMPMDAAQQRLEQAKQARDLRRRVAARRRRAQMGKAFNSASYRLRQAYGIGRGAFSFFNAASYDPDKGGYYDLAGARADIRQRELDMREATGTRFGRLSAKIYALRANNRLNRSEMTRFGKMSSRYGTSAGGRFGTSAALGLLSQYAPAELQGTMAMAGLASQFDPRLGLAVGGIGTAFNARSAGMGALGGAVGGASIGGFFGAGGAVIGAGIGALVGGIMGSINKAKQQLKEARVAAQNVVASFYAGIYQAGAEQFVRNREIIESGDLSGLGKRGAFQDVARSRAAQIGRLMQDFGQGRIDAASRVTATKASGGANQTEEYIIKQSRKGVSPQDIADQLGMSNDVGYVNRIISQYGGPEDLRGVMEALQKNQAKYGITVTDSDVDKASKSKKTLEEFFTKIGLSEDTRNAALMIADQTDARYARLQEIFNKSAAEIEVMAQTVGVDLLDPSIEFQEMVKKLGTSLRKTSAQMKQMAVDAFLGGANPFIKRREQGEAQKTIDQSTRGLFDQLSSKDLKGEERNAAIDQYLETYYTQALALTGGDATQALLMTQRAFGAGPDAGVFAKGGALQGFGAEVTARIPSGSLGGLQKEVGKPYAQDLFALINEAGFATNLSGIENAIGSLTGSNFEQLTNMLELGQIDLTKFKNAGDLQTYLSRRFGLDTSQFGVKQGQTQGLDAVPAALNASTEKTKALTDLITEITNGSKKLFVGFDPDMPEWWRNGLAAEVDETTGQYRLVPAADTATPRGAAIGDTATSKLQQTMQRHAQFNGMVPGNRTVTSSLRNFNLGSINSDHTTGAAYDLVGQNLGKYATLVRENGGFAEFHGNFAKRHLHVVPGSGPMGDTSMPAPAVSSGRNGATINNYYNFEISGGNSSPETIANIVMAKIRDSERSQRERT